jgi:hypothetical protein
LNAQGINQDSISFVHNSSTRKLKDKGSQISAIWVLASEGVALKVKAKELAKQATVVGQLGQKEKGAMTHYSKTPS